MPAPWRIPPVQRANLEGQQRVDLTTAPLGADSNDAVRLRIEIARLARRSHGRRHSIPTHPPRATLQRSIRLLDRSDEDFCARLEIVIVASHVSNNWRVGGDKDFLFSVLVFQCQRLSINRGDNLINVRVGHCALGAKIP